MDKMQNNGLNILCVKHLQPFTREKINYSLSKFIPMYALRITLKEASLSEGNNNSKKLCNVQNCEQNAAGAVGIC